jgi:serine/threonine protein phosphatase 1
LKALKQVIQRVGPSAGDRLVFIGDYVDGWSEAFETIDYLITLAGVYDCIFIKGNHDELLEEYLDSGEARHLWLKHGGESSKRSYENRERQAIRSHLRFLSSLKNYFIDRDNRLYVHAGFTNLHGPAHEYYPNLVYWDRTLWEMACSLDSNIGKDSPLFPKRLKLFKEIYIGHTPVSRIGKETPVNFANVWNVDTGAAFKGRISILDANSKDYWQSDPVWELYPDEKGRN